MILLISLHNFSFTVALVAYFMILTSIVLVFRRKLTGHHTPTKVGENQTATSNPSWHWAIKCDEICSYRESEHAIS